MVAFQCSSPGGLSRALLVNSFIGFSSTGSI